MKKNVRQTTLKHDFCIGCGICKTVCPFTAILMRQNKYQEVNPFINHKCTHCGVCVQYCPHTKKKMKTIAQTVSESINPNAFGLENSKYYLAWNGNETERIKSASGGAITKLAVYLLENKKIDAVVHVERVFNKRHMPHYQACLSNTTDKIQACASSAYQPIDFSDILYQMEKGKTYLITGTPCVIRAFKKLFKEHPHFKEIHIITCALVCSHNVSSLFLDYFADMHQVPDIPYQINLRNKDNIPDANNFKNHFYAKDKDLLKINRFKSGWTDMWRDYYFAMNACLYCSDFWGYEADISVKDAWGEWAPDPLGKSLVIIRNNDINTLFMQSGLNFEPLDFETMQAHQKQTSDFKQKCAFKKNFKNVFSKSNRRNGLFRYFITSKISKLLYKSIGFKRTHQIMTFIVSVLQKGEK